MTEEISKLVSIDFEKSSHGDAFCRVKAAEISNVCRRLQNEFGFDCLSNLTGLDTGSRFEVIYNLFSYETNKSLTLKLELEKENPVVKTVSDIWASANWFEREAFDLVGIIFEGHPNLKRIMLPADWAGHPLRKDYVEGEEYHGMSTKR